MACDEWRMDDGWMERLIALEVESRAGRRMA